MKQNIKLVAIDMDGTLLNSEKEITENTKQILEESIKQGIHIVPATGRTIKGLPEFLTETEGIRYGIFCNGAVVKDMKENRDIFTNYLQPELVQKLLNVAVKYDVMCDIYIDGMGYCEKRCIENLDYYNINPYMKELVFRTRYPQDDLFGYIREKNVPVEKINLFFHDMSERETAWNEFKELDLCNVVSSLFYNIELNVKNCSKGKALVQLAKYLNLSINSAMAFGDADNDFEMIQMAGVGVAMGNASEEIKAVADYVTSDNDHDGVAEGIKKFVL